MGFHRKHGDNQSRIRKFKRKSKYGYSDSLSRLRGTASHSMLVLMQRILA